ncbi:MAG: bL12 family ribosomal protein [Mollicutes bacterium]|nr:MAG: bL12 family ribosomal protein [Mollicutes bacterium]
MNQEKKSQTPSVEKEVKTVEKKVVEIKKPVTPTKQSVLESASVNKATASLKSNPKFDKLIVEIGKMNIQELNDFVKTVQNHFDIVPLAAAGGNTENQADASSVNTNVVLTEIGQNKIAVIKALGAITGKGLMDSKKMLDNLPVTVAANKPVAEAENLKTQLETAGAVIQLK